MMNLPFGFFPPNLRPNRGKEEKTPLTKQQKNQRESYRLKQGIQGGLNSGDTFGAAMGFMGLPWMSRGSDRHGGYAGHPQMVSPYDFLGFGGGMGGQPVGGGGGGGNGGGGNDGNGGGGNGGGGNGGGGGGVTSNWTPIDLLYPPPIGTGEQWRNTMKYGA